MASLTGNLVAETYKALLKTIDNDILTASEKQITDGFGGGSNVFIDSNGFLRANKYKVTNGLATQFLKADGSLDTNSYLTSISGAQVITALGYTPVPTTRTITINGETHNLAANNSWTVGGTSAVWGNITGTLSNQTDLQNALNAKFDDPTGNTTQYIDGTGGLQTFPTMLSSDNLIKLVRNQSGGTMTAGTIVYINGATGNKPTIAKALATSDATSAQTYGMVQANIANNADGYIVVIGNVNDLDTHSLTEGAQLYLSSTTAGAWTTTKQYAPAHLVYVGIVLRSHPTQGIIGVKIQNGYELDELHDVSAQSPINNDGIFFETATSLWKNKSIATVLGYTPQAQLSGTGFVKASGTTISYDNSTYLTTSDAASTYQLLTNLSTDLTASATKYPSVNAVIAGLALKLNLTGGTLTGNLTISSANPKLLLTDTDNNPDFSIQNADGTFKITDETNSADRFLIYSTGIGYYNGDFKANKLYVQGGLSTQFIKGDGTLDSNTYLTSASLSGYLATAGGTMTGDLNFYTLKTTRVGGNAYIRGSWQGTYWGIGAAATGHTIIIDQVDFSTGAYESITDVNLMLGTRTVIHSGNVSSYALPITGGTVTGSITATSFVKSGGTSAQFLMADGSVSTLSSPVTGSGSAGYIPKWTTAANIGSSLIYDDGTSIGIAYTTPNKGGYGRTLTGASFGSASFGFEAVSNTTTNGGLVGGLSFIVNQNDSSRIVGSAIQSNLVGTTATNYGADLRFYAKADAGVIGEVARMTSAGLRVYGTIVKDGGTSSQYLMADGSVSTFSGVTGSGTTNYIPKWTSASALGNSIVSDNGTTLSVAGGLNTYGGSGGIKGALYFRNTWNDTQYPTLYSTNSSEFIMLHLPHLPYLQNGTYGYTSATYGSIVRHAGQPTVTSYWDSGILGIQGITDAYGISRNDGAPFFYIASTGNINIGAAIDAGYKLNVNGTGKFTGNLLADRVITTTNTANSTLVAGGIEIQSYSVNNSWLGENIYFNGAAFYSRYTGYSSQIYFEGDGDMAFKTSPASVSAGTVVNSTVITRLIIKANGNVGIGIDNPTGTYSKLSVAGGISILNDNNAKLEIGRYSSGASNSYIKLGSLSNALIVTNNNDTSDIFTILNSGNVGIGTLSPISISGHTSLSISGSSISRLDFMVSDVRKGLIYSYSSGFSITSQGANPLILGSNDTENLRIVNGGNVLIGTTTDAGYKLRVNGSGYFDGAVSAYGGSGGGVDINLYFKSTWGGTQYPTIYGGSSAQFFMMHLPHVPYLQTGVNGYSGSNYGALVRFAGQAAATSYWDIGVGACGVGTDKFVIGRNESALFTITNGGNVTATAFFESSDFRLKTLIEHNPIVDGIENLKAKLYEKEGKIEMGYFAQDAELIMPYAVAKGSDGFLSLSYREIHTAKISRLEKEVAELKEKLNVA